MEISADLVKELRQRTGIGMMECKAALQDGLGDLVGKQLDGPIGVLDLVSADGGCRVVELGPPRRIAFQPRQCLQGLGGVRPPLLLRVVVEDLVQGLPAFGL